MNSFDIVVLLGLVIAIATGFNTGLLRSAVTILAYLVAMPIAVWAMSAVPPLDGKFASPLGQNWGFFLGVFLAIGMLLGKLARMALDETIGPGAGIADRLGGAALGAVRVGLVAPPWCWFSTKSSRPIASRHSSTGHSCGRCFPPPDNAAFGRCRRTSPSPSTA